MASRRRTIFSIPRIVAEHILQNVPVAEVFEISLLSKCAFSLVKNTSMTKREFDIVLSASSTVNAYYGNETVEWNFYGKRESGRQELEDMDTRTVSVSDGESGTLVFAKLSENCYGLSFNSIQDVLQFIQWLCSLFNENVFNLTPESAQFQYLKEIQAVEALKKSKKVFVMFGTVSQEEMVQVIEGFESSTLQVSCDPGPNFNYDRPICFQDFRVYTGSWTKGPILLNLHSEHVTVMNVDVNEEDVIAFLNRVLENQNDCGNMCTAVFFRDTKARESEFVYDNRPMQTWDFEKIINALSSFQQEIPPTNPVNSRRFWRKTRTSFIGVITFPEEPDVLGLAKDQNIIL